jgi:hypothetical protein
MTAAAQVLLAMAVHWGPSPSLSRDCRGEKRIAPTDKTAAIPEATRRAVLRHYPRPGQRARRAAVRGRKRSAQLSSQIRGRRFETRLGPGMIPPSKKSRTVPSCPRFGEDAEVNKP